MLLAIAAMQVQPDAGFVERTQALAMPGSTCKDSTRNTQVHPICSSADIQTTQYDGVVVVLRMGWH